MITLDTELTADGIVCRYKTGGKAATIKRESGRWHVVPYGLPPGDWRQSFHELAAAEYYALAIAIEQISQGCDTSRKINVELG